VREVVRRDVRSAGAGHLAARAAAPEHRQARKNQALRDHLAGERYQDGADRRAAAHYRAAKRPQALADRRAAERFQAADHQAAGQYQAEQ
jgi:hypothetical protein